MAQPAPKPAADLDPETPEQRRERLVWERDRIAEAEDDIVAGRYIEDEEAMAWLRAELAEAQATFAREDG